MSDDVILLFDEIYLQKCDEYVGGATHDVSENRDLYKGMICFMIVGLKKQCALCFENSTGNKNKRGRAKE